MKADLYRWGAKHELDHGSKAFIAENGAAQAPRLSKINPVRPIHLQITNRLRVCAKSWSASASIRRLNRV
jgi:hypothetical protein